MKIYFKIIHDKKGGHYHCSVFSGKRVDGSFAKLGELALDEDDFKALEDKNFELILQPKGFIGTHIEKTVFGGMLNDSPIAKVLIESVEANTTEAIIERARQPDSKIVCYHCGSEDVHHHKAGCLMLEESILNDPDFDMNTL